MIKYVDNIQLKNELKSLWAKHGLIQKDVALKMGVSGANLSNIMVNKSSLSFNDLQRMLDALGYDLYIDFVKRD